jgi:molybdopterin biosynthesis enzyme
MSNGLAIIPEECDHLPAGAVVQVVLLDQEDTECQQYRL